MLLTVHAAVVLTVQVPDESVQEPWVGIEILVPDPAAFAKLQVPYPKQLPVPWQYSPLDDAPAAPKNMPFEPMKDGVLAGVDGSYAPAVGSGSALMVLPPSEKIVPSVFCCENKVVLLLLRWISVKLVEIVPTLVVLPENASSLSSLLADVIS